MKTSQLQLESEKSRKKNKKCQTMTKNDKQKINQYVNERFCLESIHHIEDVYSPTQNESKFNKDNLFILQSPKNMYNLRKIKSMNTQLPSNIPYLTPSKPQSNIDTQLSLNTKIFEDISLIPKKNDQSQTISLSFEEQYNSSSYIHRHKSNINQNQSVYIEHRKSYRKYGKRQRQIIQYRKYQDNMQRRIVNIINKLQNQKASQKDLDCLSQKILKLNSKQLTNKYIISGLRVINRLASQISSFDCQQLEKSLSKLNDFIQKELDQTQQYEQYSSNQQILQYQQIKGKLIRKIYEIIKSVKKEISKQSLQQYSTQICQKQFKDGNINIKNMMHFIKCISK